MLVPATAPSRRISVLGAVILTFSLLGVTGAMADPALHLSKMADHTSTDDIFAPEDDLFILVTDVALEEVVAATFSVSPAGPGVAYDGVLSDMGAGTFSGSVAIGDLAGPPGLWTVAIVITDGTDEVNLSSNIVVTGEGDDEEEEEEEEDDEDETLYDVVVSGTLDVEGDVVTVAGVSFMLSPDVVVRRLGDVLDASQLEDGMHVQVKGRYQETELHALQIRVFANRGRGGEPRERAERGPWFTGKYVGTVEALDENEVVVSGATFALGEETEVRGGNGKPLEVGDPVKVFYLMQEEAPHLALRIIIMIDDDGELEVEGIVTDVDESSITLEGLGPFLVDDATLYVAEGGGPITLGDINVGDLVEIKAVATDAGNLALRVKVEEAVTIESEIDSEAEGKIIVAGQEVLVTDETLILGLNHAILSVESLRPGAVVLVQAVAATTAGKTAAQTYVAETIVVKSFASSTGTDTRDGQPTNFTLRGNYPNPFNPSTTIVFDVSDSAPQTLTLTIYNVLGQKVLTLLNTQLGAGTYEIAWDGRDSAGQAVSGGVYLYRLEVGGLASTRKMMLLK